VSVRRRVGLGWLALIVGALALAGALLGLRGDDPKPAVPTVTTVVTTTTVQSVGQPRGDVTPGVVLTSSAADVCTLGWAGKHRHGLTAAQKATILKAYGYPAGQRVAEYDHLISLELGGGNSTLNIFPMVDRAEAQRKDLLEGKLNRLVCSGKLGLPEAQDRIRTYWDDPLW